jgi:hypothetical protein
MKTLKKILCNIVVYLSNFLYAKTHIRSSKKANLLLYTDSRGTEVAPSWKQRNPYFSYLGVFDNYNVDYNFCPHKFTSILDFIEFIENNESDYEIIILHAGIVDFAPRPISSYNTMLEMKKSLLIKKGWYEYFIDRTDYLGAYEGEPTIQFFPLSFLNDIIIPKLSSLDNLLYIGINHVLLNWRGNYWRERPSSINIQLEFDKLLIEKIKNSVQLSEWRSDEIKKYTSDNVHYNSKGLNVISKEILSFLKN